MVGVHSSSYCSNGLAMHVEMVICSLSLSLWAVFRGHYRSNISQGLEFYGGDTLLSLPDKFIYNGCCSYAILLNGNIESRQGDSVSPSCPCHGILALDIEWGGVRNLMLAIYMFFSDHLLVFFLWRESEFNLVFLQTWRASCSLVELNQAQRKLYLDMSAVEGGRIAHQIYPAIHYASVLWWIESHPQLQHRTETFLTYSRR